MVSDEFYLDYFDYISSKISLRSGNYKSFLNKSLLRHHISPEIVLAPF